MSCRLRSTVRASHRLLNSTSERAKSRFDPSLDLESHHEVEEHRVACYPETSSFSSSWMHCSLALNSASTDIANGVSMGLTAKYARNWRDRREERRDVRLPH